MPEKEPLPARPFHIDPGLKESIEAETEARPRRRRRSSWASESGVGPPEDGRDLPRRAGRVEAMGEGAGGCSAQGVVVPTTELADWQKEAMEQVHELIEAEQARGAGEAGRAGGRLLSGGGGRRGGRAVAGGGGADGRQRAEAEQGRRAYRRQARAKQWTEFNARKPDERYEATRAWTSRPHTHTAPSAPYTATPPAPLLTGTRTPPTSPRPRTRGSTWETFAEDRRRLRRPRGAAREHAEEAAAARAARREHPRDQDGVRERSATRTGAAPHDPPTPTPPFHPAPPPPLSPQLQRALPRLARPQAADARPHARGGGRLAEINAELGAPPPVPLPTSLEPEEEPERRMVVTDADIDEFTAKLEKKRRPKGTAPTLAARRDARQGRRRPPPRAAARAAPAAPGRRWRRRRGCCVARGSSTSGPRSTSARGRWRRSTVPSPNSALRSCGSRPT